MQNKQDRFENRLAQTFQRVKPSPAFLNIVRGHIQVRHPQVMVKQFSRQRREILITLGGVLSASLLILTLARVIYYLLGRSKQPA
jgi:aspartokinase